MDKVETKKSMSKGVPVKEKKVYRKSWEKVILVTIGISHENALYLVALIEIVQIYEKSIKVS